MIISFPTHLQSLEAMRAVPKDVPTVYAHQAGGLPLVFMSPVDLQPGDLVLLDIQTSVVHIVQRGDFAIWRSGWLN